MMPPAWVSVPCIFALFVAIDIVDGVGDTLEARGRPRAVALGVSSIGRAVALAVFVCMLFTSVTSGFAPQATTHDSPVCADSGAP